MTNYYKYLPVRRVDELWGLCVLNSGCNLIHKSEIYPPQNHPSHHYFNWNKGRVFNEYQIIYITKGQCVFESESCSEQIVKEGSVIFLYSNEQHRYKPDPLTGWDELWISFKGSIVENLIGNHYCPTKIIELG